MRFILEHSVSPVLADALNALDDQNEIGHIRAIIGDASTPDEVWLVELPKLGYGDAIVITADPNILRNPGRRAVWLGSGVVIGFLKSFADCQHWDQAAKLVKWWPSIVVAARRAHPPGGFTVSVQGKIEPFILKP